MLHYWSLSVKTSSSSYMGTTCFPMVTSENSHRQPTLKPHGEGFVHYSTSSRGCSLMILNTYSESSFPKVLVIKIGYRKRLTWLLEENKYMISYYVLVNVSNSPFGVKANILVSSLLKSNRGDLSFFIEILESY